MPKASTRTLADGRTVDLVQATAADTPADLAAVLARGQPGPVVVVAGGDDAVPEALRPRVSQLLARGVLRALHEACRPLGLEATCLVRASGDGVPALLGRAMPETGQAVRLLGVAPEGALALPGDGAEAEAGRAAPVAGLTQLLVVPGTAWGDASRWTLGLAQALAARAGDNAARETGAGPVPRRPMLLLIGGGPAARAEVLAAVRLGWPVLLVEGSGGWADELARQIKAGEADGDDPDVADILADGRMSTVTLGNKAAGAVEALARLVQRECGGDSLLRLAWQRFAALDSAAVRQQRAYGQVQVAIQVLGVVVVAMSVAYAAWDLAWLRYALIVTPICVSALVALSNRFSPGRRWVLLRAAAEAIKREIYRYRVRPLRAPVDGGREKQLARAIEDITRRLARTEINTMGLPPYRGDLPPRDALAAGDDGLSMLGSGDYVRLRIVDQLTWYRSKTTGLERRASRWQAVSIGVGALGTLLAALGGGWVAWVALTSAVAGAAAGFLSYKQFEATLTGYNQTATDLENIHAWWTALLPDEQADPANAEKLVVTAEQVLADEQGKWAQNMTDALEALRGKAQAADKPDADAAAGTKPSGVPPDDAKTQATIDPANVSDDDASVPRGN